MGFAGDTFNTAWYAARVAGADIDVAYLTAIGDDEPSREMVRFIEASGIRPVVSVVEGRSVGLYVISLKDGERSFSYWRDASAARRLTDQLGGLEALREGDVAFFSGISLAILDDECREKLLAACADARLRGVTIAFDPNLRPRLWSSAEDMCKWITRAADVSDIALPSFEDEESYFGDADREATAQRYQQSGVELVIVKDGAGPVLVAEANSRQEVTPQSVDAVIDSTAAGDSFNGQFLSAWMQGKPTREAAAMACELSRKVIRAPGALVEV